MTLKQNDNIFHWELELSDFGAITVKVQQGLRFYETTNSLANCIDIWSEKSAISGCS
jgi:hypothetical protein